MVDPTGHTGMCGAFGPTPFAVACEVVTGVAGTPAGQQALQHVESLVVQYSPAVIQLLQQWGDKLPALVDQAGQLLNGSQQAASQAGNTADPGGLRPNDPRFRDIVDMVKGAKASIETDKIDFWLGKVTTPGTIEKSTQRGIDFVQKLGYSEESLRVALMDQVRNFDAVSQMRLSKLGDPLLNFESIVTGPSGLQAKLVSSWELKDGVLRLVTSWAEILK
jgi:hypothetical protein